MAATAMFSYLMALLPTGARTPPAPSRTSRMTTVNTTRKTSMQSNISFRTASESSESTKAEGRPPPSPRVQPNTTLSTIRYDLESQTTSETMVNRRKTTAPEKPPPTFVTRLSTWAKPSERTIYTAILGASDGMIVPFAVMASLAGVTNARLVMLAGLAEVFGGAISMGAGGVLGAKSDEERHQAEMRCKREQIETDPLAARDCLTSSIIDDLPPDIVTAIETHYNTLSPAAKIQLIMRFQSDPDPCPADTYKAALTFFLVYFSGLPALIPYIVVRSDQVNLAFYISIGITTVLSFLYGWIKTGYNVGWSGWRNVMRCLRGGVVFFGVVAVAAVLSVVITRGIDHNL